MSEDKILGMFNQECEVSQTTSVYNCFDIYLDEDIKDPTYYRKAFQVLRSAQQGDLVRIYISSNGGNMNSAAIFKNCIEECQGHVVAIIEAEAYSAASLIALSCFEIKVQPYATMMCHSAAFGSGGIVQNVRDHVEFVGRNAEALMEEVYKDFLTDLEFIDLKRGREIWLDHIQIGVRLDKMFEARQAQGCGDENCEGCSLESEEDYEELDLDALIEQKVSTAVAEALAKQKPAKKTKPTT